ncbi:MAG: type IV pilus assembly protein PilM [Patescibacteria group bacterium]|jgi:type IV pilus assembly protein PilM
MFDNFVQNSFGLDISERAWRLVQLKKNGRQISIAAFGEIAVPVGVLKNGKFSDQDQAIKLFKTLLENLTGGHLNTHYVSVSLPETETFIKIINITYPKNKNILEEVINEAKNHIPYPLEKTYLDWQFVDENKTKAVIGVCPKEIVDNFQTTLSSAGLMPIVLEIEATSIARAIFPSDFLSAEPIMVIDLGFSRTGLFVYEKNCVGSSLSLNFSSDLLTKSIMTTLNLSAPEAEEAKRKIGLDPTLAKGGIKQVLLEPIKKLAVSIREAKYFYNEHLDHQEPINKVLLTGGGSNLKQLPEVLSELTQIKVEVANPLVNLSMGSLNFPENKIQSFNTAIGLALRQFN